MKLLLDENLPEELRHLAPGHDVFTVRFMGWKGVKNGELLRLARAEDCDALLTSDAGIEHEHNLETLPIGIIVLHAKSNSLKSIVPMVPALVRAIHAMAPRTLVHVA